MEQPRPADGSGATAEGAARFRAQVEPEIEVLLRVAGSLTANQADAEDLVQETLLRAYRAIDRFDGRHPRAWLLTILRNTNASLHRRKRPSVVEDEVLALGAPAFGKESSASAEDDAIAAEIGPELRAGIAALKPAFRQAVILVDVNDLSYAEAAAVMDVPVGTVMSRLSRARAKLREHLASAGHLRGAESEGGVR